MFFAAASAISISQLPPRFAQDSVHFVSYTMAISSMASLFFALLVGCVLKHADGVRRSTPAAAMVEREVNWWGSKCAQFGAKIQWWPLNLNTCECPYELPLPRNCEGKLGRTFDLKRSIKAHQWRLSDTNVCHCEDPCPQYGAKRDFDQCRCPKDRPRPSEECGAYMGHILEIFTLNTAKPFCRCLTEAEYMDQR